jgi:hypothetical protein
MKEETQPYCFCPFDKTHIFVASKWKKHVEKCKSPARREYEQCRYDPYHWVYFKEIDAHE